MSTRKSRSNPTLGDSAADFMAQWAASRPKEKAPGRDGGNDAAKLIGSGDVRQTLSSWKRRGGDVAVSKGASKGRQAKLQRPPGAVAVGAYKTIIPAMQRVVPSAPSIPSTAQETLPKSLRQRLMEASADVRNLRIAAGMSRPRGSSHLPPVAETKNGKLAILGLDFGTAFTKAVVRWAGRHYAVDWSEAVEGDDHHLLASVFSEAPDGRCVLGANPSSGWSVQEGIKLQLLSSEGSSLDDRMADAVIFIALTFRYVDGWLRRTSPDAATGLRWRLHVGLPTKSWDNDEIADKFKTVAQAGRVLACMQGAVTRAAAKSALRMTDLVDRPAVDVFPEFACQLYAYLLSAERREDLHALVDIGAGTLDVAYFNVFMKDGEALLPIFASEVDKLGAHYLVAALAGASGGSLWADHESSLSDEGVGRKIGCPANDVRDRRSLYLSSVAEVFNKATQSAKKAYPTSPAWARSVRLFLCGGGGRISCLKKRFESIAAQAPSVLGIKFQVSELVKPRDLVGKLNSGFDRLSVAYGLSQLAAEIGHVMRSATLEPITQREALERVDRDADR